MRFRSIFLVLTIACSHASIADVSEATLRAQLTSMQACQVSLKHTDCNLKILDQRTRELLIRMNSLNSARQTNQNIDQLSGSRVGFFTDSVFEANDDVLRLLGGTIWRLDRYYFGLPLEDVIVVRIDDRFSRIYVNDNIYVARLISGSAAMSSGLLTSVVTKIGDGTILRLSDGSMLEFSSYDKYDTGWWLPPYEVLIDLNSMNMWNLEKGKKVWIQKIIQ